MYQAPLRELRFVLDELLGTQSLAGMRGLEDYSSGARGTGVGRSRPLRAKKCSSR